MTEIATGLMAHLITGDVVRIVAVDECGVKVETLMGLAYVPERWIVSTYAPCEAVGGGKPFVETSGIELGE